MITPGTNLALRPIGSSPRDYSLHATLATLSPLSSKCAKVPGTQDNPFLSLHNCKQVVVDILIWLPLFRSPIFTIRTLKSYVVGSWLPMEGIWGIRVCEMWKRLCLRLLVYSIHGIEYTVGNRDYVAKHWLGTGTRAQLTYPKVIPVYGHVSMFLV